MPSVSKYVQNSSLSTQRCVLGLVCVLAFVACFKPHLSQAADSADSAIRIWEFSPYEVEVWYSIDAGVPLSEKAKEYMLFKLHAQLSSTFRAAWRTRIAPMPTELETRVQRDFATFKVADMRDGELTLVLSSENESTKSLRTFAAAVEKLDQIFVTKEALATVSTEVANLNIPEDAEGEAAMPTELLKKLVVDDSGIDSISRRLTDGSIAAALVPREQVEPLGKSIRSLLTILPWQTESFLRGRDKLFFLHIAEAGEELVVQCRELDCSMQYLSEVFTSRAISYEDLARVCASTIKKTFAPIARVEDAEAKTAELRHRAGGLILRDTNPARIHVGDVMQPIIRRNDRNGIPTLLQPLSWTFAAITASDGVKMKVNVYTYSGGPGLTGRKNRRTQRVLLRVRPRVDETDIEIAAKTAKGEAIAGCFVYARHHLTGDFDLLGRTDWRGRFTVPVPADSPRILPEDIRRQRFLDAKAAAQKAAEEEAKAKNEAAAKGEAGEDAEEDEAPPQPKPPAKPKLSDFDNDEAVVSLNYPLTLIYVKNGDTVLAKLPMVPGLREIENAELLDDSRRLEAEAFFRGFQGEILDLIGLRSLLSARVEGFIQEKKWEQAEKAMDELRSLPNFNEMADQLSNLGTRMIDESRGPVSRLAKRKIDRMQQNTRDMLQKYLQDNLVVATEGKLSKAKKSAGSETPADE